jgi:hypothetical protein
MSMSLDSAAKVAEVVGAISVVIGLIFVGFEIRENTVAQQFSATQTLVSEYNSAISAINDREFVCIFIHAGNNFTNLSQSDKIRFSILMQPVFRTFEQLHYSDLKGTIDLNVYSGFQQQYIAMMQLPGNQQYWAARRHWFGGAFQEYTDKIIADGQSLVSSDESAVPSNFDSEGCE